MQNGYFTFSVISLWYLQYSIEPVSIQCWRTKQRADNLQVTKFERRNSCGIYGPLWLNSSQHIIRRYNKHSYWLSIVRSTSVSFNFFASQFSNVLSELLGLKLCWLITFSHNWTLSSIQVDIRSTLSSSFPDTNHSSSSRGKFSAFLWIVLSFSSTSAQWINICLDNLCLLNLIQHEMPSLCWFSLISGHNRVSIENV